MNKKIWILLLFMMPLMAESQNITISNQKTIGGFDEDYLNDVIHTNDGGFLLLHSSTSDASFEKADSLIGGADWWVVKMDSALNIEWQNTIGSTRSDNLYGGVELNDGYILAGTADSLATGDKTVENYGDADAWVVKISKQGVIQWQKVFGGTDNDRIYDLVKDTLNKRIYATGFSYSDSSGTKTENSRGFSDGWVMAFDYSGNIIWDKTVGGDGFESNQKMVLYEDKLVLVMGSSSDQGFEKSEDCYGEDDVWVVCMDTTGTILWDKTLGGIYMEMFPALQINNDTIFITAISSSGQSGNKLSQNFGPAFSSFDIWMKYLDIHGNTLNMDTIYGGTSSDGSFSLSVLPSNHLLLAGYSRSNISGNKSEDIVGVEADYWLLEVGTNGQIIWQKNIGGADVETLTKAFKTSANNYILFGSSESDVGGDKTGFNRGKTDTWIVELNVQTGIPQVMNFHAGVYPNPGEKKVCIETGFKGKVEFYTVDGKKVYTSEIKSGNNHFDLSHLEQGMYILQFYDNYSYKGAIKWIKQ